MMRLLSVVRPCELRLAAALLSSLHEPLRLADWQQQQPHSTSLEGCSQSCCAERRGHAEAHAQCGMAYCMLSHQCWLQGINVAAAARESDQVHPAAPGPQFSVARDGEGNELPREVGCWLTC